MDLSIWFPIDFFIGLGRSRSRLIDVPVVTEERMSDKYRVYEVSLTILVHLTVIIDLKRFDMLRNLDKRTFRSINSCQPNRARGSFGRSKDA